MKGFLIALMVVAVASWVKGQCPTELSQAQKDAILKTHNELRNKVASGGETNFRKAADMIELVWNDQIAEIAQKWASNGKFDHDKASDRQTTDENGKVVECGQNIGTTDVSADPDYSGAVKSFLDDEKDALYNANIISAFKSKYLKTVGHASQVLWAKTKAIGCGTYPTTVGSDNYCMLVCNYAPPGNYNGKPIYTESDDAASQCSSVSPTYTSLCANPGGLT